MNDTIEVDNNKAGEPILKIPLHLIVKPSNVWRREISPMKDWIRVETVSGRIIGYVNTNPSIIEDTLKNIDNLIKDHNKTAIKTQES